MGDYEEVNSVSSYKSSRKGFLSRKNTKNSLVNSFTQEKPVVPYHPGEARLKKQETQQLNDQAYELAIQGSGITGRSLAKASEARQIGVATAEKLATQTEQIEHLNEEFEEVHDTLNRSENVINKMTMPVFGHFGKKRKDSTKITEKEAAHHEQMKNTGVRTLDLEGMKARDELLKKNSRRPPKQDYSHIKDKRIVEALEKQDQDVAQIGKIANDLNSLAVAMNNELHYQNELIEGLDEEADKVTNHIRKNDEKLRKML